MASPATYDETYDTALAAWRGYQGKVSIRRRWRPEEDTTDLQRRFVCAKIAHFVEETLADAPPLNPEQIERLVGLIRAGGAG
jgi:hypothetical protein